MKVFIINGAPRAGKDSFVNFCSEKYSCKNYSTVDHIKDIARLLGWDGRKTPESRHMLSDLKDLSTKYFNGSMNLLTHELLFEIWKGNIDFFFIHAREPEEIDQIKFFVREELHIPCKTILVRRPSEEDEITNHADREVENYDYDYILNNDSTLDNWHRKAWKFIETQYNYVN